MIADSVSSLGEAVRARCRAGEDDEAIGPRSSFKSIATATTCGSSSGSMDRLPQGVLRLERHGVGIDWTQNVVRGSLRGELALRNDHGAVTEICFKSAVEAEERRGHPRQLWEGL